MQQDLHCTLARLLNCLRDTKWKVFGTTAQMEANFGLLKWEEADSHVMPKF